MTVPNVLGDGIGSVTLLNRMGDDLTVVDSARVSFAKESAALGRAKTLGYDIPLLSVEDKRLLEYLATHNHWTPFGHAQIQVRVKAPISVARQLVKHQVGLVWNEVSRRYVSDKVEFYFPPTLRLKPEGSIKQGSSEQTTPAYTRRIWDTCDGAITLYKDMLAAGVAPEEARMVLPLSTYTEWIWTGSLMAWIRIIKLRDDPHAQSQTQQYGKAFSKIICHLYPESAAAWGLRLSNV